MTMKTTFKNENYPWLLEYNIMSVGRLVFKKVEREWIVHETEMSNLI